MSNFQFVRSDAGVRALMQSQEMQDVLVDFAQQVAEKAAVPVNQVVVRLRLSHRISRVNESFRK